MKREWLTDSNGREYRNFQMTERDWYRFKTPWVPRWLRRELYDTRSVIYRDEEGK